MYDNKQLSTMSSQELYQIFGGKDKRGATNQAIRYLDGKGFTRAAIAKMLDLRYQHVRNVLNTELKTDNTSKSSLSVPPLETI